jgi:nitrogen fixation NifU-like protein
MADADLYQKAIVDAARSGREYPRLPAPDGTATVDNPLCGDRVTVDVRLEDETVAEVGQRVRGCLLCEASGALIARHAPGCAKAELQALRGRVADMLKAETDEDARRLADALGAGWDALGAFVPVRRYRSRHECVLLPFEALGKALG